jgi:hypothetical protein
LSVEKNTRYTSYDTALIRLIEEGRPARLDDLALHQIVAARFAVAMRSSPAHEHFEPSSPPRFAKLSSGFWRQSGDLLVREDRGSCYGPGDACQHNASHSISSRWACGASAGIHESSLVLSM